MTDHRFGRRPPFTIGIEEELLLVHPETHALAPVSAAVLNRMACASSAVGHDLYAAQIELRTTPTLDVHDAVRELGALRQMVIAAGGTPVGVGMHPEAALGDVALVKDARYREVAATFRGLVQRAPECALHIHVGMPDKETAITVLRGLREYLPLLKALAGNSPYWFGVDSGLASARATLVRAYPRHGVPQAFANWDDYDRTLRAYREVFGIEDPRMVWWDLRLSPSLGTVELRGLDSQSSLRTIASIAALVQALAHTAALAGVAVGTSTEILAEATFRADRDGVAAEIPAEARLVSIADAAASAIERTRESACTFGSATLVGDTTRLVSTGGAAAWQRRLYMCGGFRRLLDGLIKDTAFPAEWQTRVPSEAARI